MLAGTPFQANSQSALFYPFNFLYYLLPPPAAWAICLAIRMFLAAVFMALFVRTIGGSTGGSIVSGVIFAACGFMTAWQGQAMGDAAIWLPMICYSVHRVYHDRSYRSIALAGFAFAMPVLAGHPETAAHLTVTGSALALSFCLFPDRHGPSKFDWRFSLRFVLAGLLAIGLSAVQILPTLEWMGQIMPPLGAPWPALSRHDGQGFFSRDILASPNSAGIPIPEAAAYLGMLALLVAPLAFFHKSRRYVFFLAAIGAAAAAVAFSIEPVHWVVAHLPIVKSMKNGRLILVVSFAIAGMAGLGISVLEQAEALTSRQRKATLSLLAGTFMIAALGIFEVHRATLSPVDPSRGPSASLVFLVLSGIVAGSKIMGGLTGRTFSIIVCIVAAVDLVSFSYGYTGFTRTSEVFPSAPVFNFLRGRERPATYRLAKAGYPIPANSGIMYDIETADGYEVCTARARNFTADLTEQRDDAVFFLADKLSQAKDRRIDLLNVKYLAVITPGPEFEQLGGRPDKFAEIYRQGSIAVFENKSVLPRLFAVLQSGIEVIEDPQAQLARLKNPAFNPEQAAVFSERPLGLRKLSDQNEFKSDIRLVEKSVNGYTFHIQTSRPSVLVLSQIYYPGWKAAIDGTEVPVYAVDYALSGILASEGDHRVRFFFRPLSFRIGEILSVISLVVVLCSRLESRTA
jgi:hypothetical protein